MTETRTLKCPNCSAPLVVELGQVEADCDYCDCRVRFVPGTEELEVVRTREQMKSRERLALEQERMRQVLQREEADRWRQTAARVAIQAAPLIGRGAARAVFKTTLGRSSGCLGCGCLVPLVALGSLALWLARAFL